MSPPSLVTIRTREGKGGRVRQLMPLLIASWKLRLGLSRGEETGGSVQATTPILKQHNSNLAVVALLKVEFPPYRQLLS